MGLWVNGVEVTEAQRVEITPSGTTQAIRIYNPGSGGLEYLDLLWDGNILYIQTLKTGAGSTRALSFGTFLGSDILALNADGSISLNPKSTGGVGIVTANVAAGFNLMSFLQIGNKTEGGTAFLNIRTKQVITASLSGATVNMAFQIPSGAMFLGAQFNVDTLITGATSWSAALNTGSSTSLGSGYAVALNTKVNKLVVPEVLSAATDITLTAAVSDFTAGVIEGVVYYIDLTSMASA